MPGKAGHAGPARPITMPQMAGATGTAPLKGPSSPTWSTALMETKKAPASGAFWIGWKPFT